MTVIPQTITRTTRNGKQVYVLMAVEQRPRADGAQSRYAVWRSLCRDCGAPFYVTSGTSRAAVAKGPGNVHCPAHRRHTTYAAADRDAALAERYQPPEAAL